MRMQIDTPEIEVFMAQGRGIPDLSGYDLIVFNRDLGKEHYPFLHKVAELGIPYIVDIDDFWRLPKYHHASKQFKRADLTNAIKDAIRYAAGVTTTTERLAAEIRPLNHNVSILPNAIEWTDEQWAVVKDPSDKLRFGWVGGITHENDLNMIAVAMNHILDNHDAEFHICGYMPHEPIWQRIAKMLPKAILHQGVPVNEYGKFYSLFDVAIAPLEDTKYNSMKSELKMIECAEYGMPIIASSNLPYSEHKFNMGMVWASNTLQDWKNALSFFLINRNLVKEFGQYNYDYCHRQFDIEKINNKRLAFYQRICKSTTKDRA
jgi:glycosyltransferase involved in cell wall biosynthesis